MFFHHRERPERFSVEVEPEGRRVHVMVRGELDVATAPALEAVLDELTVAGTQVVLDLRQLRFVDASAVGLLIRAGCAVKRIGADLTLVPSEPVRRMLDICSLGDRFTCLDRPPVA
jgi:anti-anti-sigma factor